MARERPTPTATDDAAPSRKLMYAAAKLYYEDDVRQGDIARRLEVSPATVSRLIAEARRRGMVRIEVLPPEDSEVVDVAKRLEVALGLDAVALSPVPASAAPGLALTPPLSRLLVAAGLRTGDALLVSLGRTVYEIAQGDLTQLRNVRVAPMVGGHDEPEVWYATNELTRQVAAKVGGTPSFLYAPALPGPEARATLLKDPSIRRVVDLWGVARCAILGIGAPPALRTSLPAFVPVDGDLLRDAVGDVLTRFFDHSGAPVHFPGSERLLAVDFDRLRGIPACIAVAAGLEKVPGILAAGRAGYFNQLVTDRDTAIKLIEAAESSGSSAQA